MTKHGSRRPRPLKSWSVLFSESVFCKTWLARRGLLGYNELKSFDITVLLSQKEREKSMRATQLRKALSERRLVKVIAGISNFDLENVLQIVAAADQAGVDAVDVAARPGIVAAVRKQTELVVFASCVRPENLLAAMEAGADAVELGNYDALYDDGLFLNQADVLRLAEETVALVDGRALISVTVPGHLSLDAQVELARQLEALGVDMIQTEGAARMLSENPEIKRLTAGEKAAMSLHNTAILVKYTSLPVMTASGIGPDNVAKAFGMGAAAVGIGSAVNKLSGVDEMVQVLSAIQANCQPVAMSQVS